MAQDETLQAFIGPDTRSIDRPKEHVYRPLKPNERRDNGDGTYSTEVTRTEDLGDNKFSVFPSLWADETGNLVELEVEDAVNAARNYEGRTGARFPRFNSIEEANQFAAQRSAKGGRSQGLLEGFAEGGQVSMNPVDQEMSMGAMPQPSPNEVHPGQAPAQALNAQTPVDPVSGNPVPVGAKPANVRDNIPAKLSEGEFVIPADVAGFYGIDKLQKMIAKARRALASNNTQQQSGPEDEQLPFPAEELMMAEGGQVNLDQPVDYRAFAVQPNPNDNIGHAPLTPGVESNQVEVKVFRDHTGFIRYVPFVNGNPIGEVPAGSTEVGSSTGGAKTANPSQTDGGPQRDNYEPKQEESFYDAKKRNDEELQKDYRGQLNLVDTLYSPQGQIASAAAGLLAGPLAPMVTMAKMAQRPSLKAIENEMVARGLGIPDAKPGDWTKDSARGFDKSYYGVGEDALNAPGNRFSGQSTVVSGGNASTKRGDWDINTARTPTEQELNSKKSNSASGDFAGRDFDSNFGSDKDYGSVSGTDTSDGIY